MIRQEEAEAPAKSVKILLRRNASGSNVSESDSPLHGSDLSEEEIQRREARSFAQREEEYAKARARIFSEEQQQQQQQQQQQLLAGEAGDAAAGSAGIIAMDSGEAMGDGMVPVQGGGSELDAATAAAVAAAAGAQAMHQAPLYHQQHHHLPPFHPYHHHHHHPHQGGPPPAGAYYPPRQGQQAQQQPPLAQQQQQQQQQQPQPPASPQHYGRGDKYAKSPMMSPQAAAVAAPPMPYWEPHVMPVAYQAPIMYPPELQPIPGTYDLYDPVTGMEIPAAYAAQYHAQSGAYMPAASWAPRVPWQPQPGGDPTAVAAAAAGGAGGVPYPQAPSSRGHQRNNNNNHSRQYQPKGRGRNNNNNTHHHNRYGSVDSTVSGVHLTRSLLLATAPIVHNRRRRRPRPRTSRLSRPLRMRSSMPMAHRSNSSTTISSRDDTRITITINSSNSSSNNKLTMLLLLRHTAIHRMMVAGTMMVCGLRSLSLSLRSSPSSSQYAREYLCAQRWELLDHSCREPIRHRFHT